MTTAIEKSWPAVPPQLLTANGTALGVITVADSSGFKVKQQIAVVATGQPNLIVKILRFTSPTSFYVGPTNPKAGGGNTRVDLSLYTVAAGAYVYAEEQPKVTVKPEDIFQAVYRQEPGTTIGVEIDDKWGNPIDSVVGPDGKTRLAVDAEVSVELKNIGLFNLPYDTVAVTYPSSSVENYQTFVGGLTGTPVQLVVVTYTDNTKNAITSVVRTPSGP